MYIGLSFKGEASYSKEKILWNKTDTVFTDFDKYIHEHAA